MQVRACRLFFALSHHFLFLHQGCTGLGLEAVRFVTALEPLFNSVAVVAGIAPCCASVFPALAQERMFVCLWCGGLILFLSILR